MLSLIVRFCTKYMSIGVVLIGIFSIFWPEVMKPFAPKIPTLLGIIMFGMGTTLDLKDFLVIFRRPRDIFLGALAQYTIMPFLAFALGTLFALEPGLTAGLVLLGACPGGTTSNVITYMSKGDLAYSVTMTSVSTLLSPVLTPALTFFLIGKEIAFDPVGMFLSILQLSLIHI